MEQWKKLDLMMSRMINVYRAALQLKNSYDDYLQTELAGGWLVCCTIAQTRDV